MSEKYNKSEQHLSLVAYIFTEVPQNICLSYRNKRMSIYETLLDIIAFF